MKPLRASAQTVLSRLDLLGQTVEAARSEYEAVVGEALEYSSTATMIKPANRLASCRSRNSAIFAIGSR